MRYEIFGARPKTNTFSRRAAGLLRGRYTKTSVLLFSLGTMLLCALMANVTLFLYLHSPQASAVGKVSPSADEKLFDTVQLLTPAEDVAPGTPLKRVAMEPLPWPRNRIPEGSIRIGSDLSNYYATRMLRASQPLFYSDLSKAPDYHALWRELPPGFRAVAIEVAGAEQREGWVKQGAHVDVSVTYTDKAEQELKSILIIEDAVVISVDGRKRLESPEAFRSPQSSTITLRVNIEQALQLQTAKSLGRISLQLRNDNDPLVGRKSFGSSDFGRRKVHGKAPQKPRKSPVMRNFEMNTVSWLKPDVVSRVGGISFPKTRVTE